MMEWPLLPQFVNLSKRQTKASRMLSFAPKEEFVHKTGLLGRFAKYTLAE